MRETPESALSFEHYYSLGEDRTLLLLAQRTREDLIKKNQEDTKPIPTEATLLSRYKKWSTEHKWQERIIVRDRQKAEEKRKKLEKEIDAMNDRQAMIGTTQQARAIKQIEALIAAEKFGALASVTLLKLALEAEREARGASISKIELTGAGGGPIETSGIAIYLPKKDEEK